MLTALSENEVGREEYLLLTDEDIAEMAKPIGVRRRLINLRKTDALDLVVTALHACMHAYGYILMIKLATLHSRLCALFRETSTSSLDPIWTNMIMMMKISGAVK